MVDMKGQLTRCKNGKLKNFDYCHSRCFSLERVPILRPQQILANGKGSRDPRLMRWVALMAPHTGDGPVVRYTTKFFDWLGQHIVPIEDFSYARIDYRGDPNIPLLVGAQ